MYFIKNIKNWFKTSKIYKCMICDDELTQEKLFSIYNLYEETEEEEDAYYHIYTNFLIYEI